MGYRYSNAHVYEKASSVVPQSYIPREDTELSHSYEVSLHLVEQLVSQRDCIWNQILKDCTERLSLEDWD